MTVRVALAALRDMERQHAERIADLERERSRALAAVLAATPDSDLSKAEISALDGVRAEVQAALLAWRAEREI